MSWTQSVYLYMNKFKGRDNLIQNLNSSFEKDYIGLNKQNVKANQDAYGKNKYPRPKTKSVMDLINDALKDQILKILIATSILSLIFELNAGGFKEGGWILGASILLTFLAIAVVSSISAYNCQQHLIELQFQSEE